MLCRRAQSPDDESDRTGLATRTTTSLLLASALLSCDEAILMRPCIDGHESSGRSLAPRALLAWAIYFFLLNRQRKEALLLPALFFFLLNRQRKRLCCYPL